MVERMLNRERLRQAAEGTARTPKSIPRELTRANLSEGVLMALDPSLGATGLVVVRHTEEAFEVLRAKQLQNTSELAGTEKNYHLAEVLSHQLNGEIDQALDDFGPDLEIVHEAPPAGGGKISHPESSLLAGREVQRAAYLHHLALLPMVYPQGHQRLVVGSSTAKKKELRTFLPLLVASLPIVGYELVTNEATRDALSVAIYALHRRRG